MLTRSKKRTLEEAQKDAQGTQEVQNPLLRFLSHATLAVDRTSENRDPFSFECGICLETINATDMALLPCNHVLCRDDLDKIIATDLRLKKNHTCPFCRGIFDTYEIMHTEGHKRTITPVKLDPPPMDDPILTSPRLLTALIDVLVSRFNDPTHDIVSNDDGEEVHMINIPMTRDSYSANRDEVTRQLGMLVYDRVNRRLFRNQSIID